MILLVQHVPGVSGDALAGTLPIVSAAKSGFQDRQKHLKGSLSSGRQTLSELGAGNRLLEYRWIDGA